MFILQSEFITSNLKTMWDVGNDTVNLFLSLAAVFIAWKAYRVALSIFNRGVRIDQGKVLTQVSLEIVSEFVILFNRLENAVSPLWEDFTKPVDASLKIMTVLDILKKYSFSCSDWKYRRQTQGLQKNCS